MALAETAKLVASLELKDHFSPAANKAMANLGRLESRATRVGQQIGKGLNNAAHNLRNVGIVAAAGIAVAVRGGVQSLAELEDATTSVDGAIQQMGLSGQVTSSQIATWANEIEANVQAAFDDKAIVQATSTLLRFGKVTPGNIRPAMQVITDLATKTGDVDSAASLLAKALADPEKAAGKLSRQGVILTKEQQKQIKAFVKNGKVAQAQKVILDSVATATKGAAAASAGPYRDALNIMGDVTEDAQRALGIGFLPVITKVADLLSSELAKPSTIQGLKDFGTGLASGLDKLIDIARNLPWSTIGDSLRIAGAGARAVLDAFTGLPPWVQTAVLTGWGLNKLTGGALGGIVKELAGGLVKGVLGMTAGVVNAKAGVVNVIGGGVPGGVPAGGGKGGGLPSVLPAAGSAGAGLLGIGALTVGALILAPLAVAAIGLAITKPIEAVVGRSKTAEARGVPAWNNAALQQLNKIAANTNPAAPQPRGQEALRDTFDRAILPTVAAADGTTSSVDALKGKIADDLAANKAAIDAAASTGAAATSAGAGRVTAAQYAAAGIVAGAVRASQPTVNTDVRVYVTAGQVTKSVTEQTRYGPANGSAGGAGTGSTGNWTG